MRENAATFLAATLSAVSIVLLGGACGELAAVPDSTAGAPTANGGAPASDGGSRESAAGDGALPTGDAGEGGSAYRAAVLADMPIAYYRLDDAAPVPGAGAPLLDEVSGQRVGTLHGAPAFSQPGAAGHAIHFDGNSWIDLPPRVFPGLAAFTIELWMKADENAHSHVLTNQRRPPGRKDGWAVLCDTKIGFERYFNNLPEYTDKGLLRQFERFVHVAVTYDGQMVRLVMDGMQVDQFPDMHAMPDHGSLTILGAASAAGELRYKGSVDEVAFYDRRLSDAELMAHVAAAAR